MDYEMQSNKKIEHELFFANAALSPVGKSSCPYDSWKIWI
jgi:hypothetical protein